MELRDLEAYGVRADETLVKMCSLPEEGESVESERELILEDAHSISQGLWRMVNLAQDVADSLHFQFGA